MGVVHGGGPRGRVTFFYEGGGATFNQSQSRAKGYFGQQVFAGFLKTWKSGISYKIQGKNPSID